MCRFLSSMMSDYDIEHTSNGSAHTHNDYRSYGPGPVTNFLPDAHAQIQLMLNAWQQKKYGQLSQLANEFATETESLGIPHLPVYSRSLAGYAEQNNNNEIHATFLQFCKWAEKVETGSLNPLVPEGTFPVSAMPITHSPNSSLLH